MLLGSGEWQDWAAEMRSLIDEFFTIRVCMFSILTLHMRLPNTASQRVDLRAEKTYAIA